MEYNDYITVKITVNNNEVTYKLINKDDSLFEDLDPKYISIIEEHLIGLNILAKSIKTGYVTTFNIGIPVYNHMIKWDNGFRWWNLMGRYERDIQLGLYNLAIELITVLSTDLQHTFDPTNMEYLLKTQKELIDNTYHLNGFTFCKECLKN